MLRILSIWLAMLFASPAFAQANVLLNYQSLTGAVQVSSANPLPVNAIVTVSFPTIGAAVPATGIYDAINVGGTLRGLTGANPSGTIYAAQIDIASVAGATVATGHGVAAGVLRVELPTDGTGLVNAAQSGTWTVQAGIGITPTDRTIASASGSSQQMMAGNVARHSLTINNTGNANCGVNPTGGTAAIGGAGTLTLVPNGAYTPRIPTLSAVTVICTTGQPIYGDEN